MTTALERPAAAVAAAVAEIAAADLAASLPRSGGQHERIRAAGSRWLSPQLATKLARSATSAVRRALAGNPAAPAVVIEQLLADRDVSVRITARGNPVLPFTATPGADLAVLVTHPGCHPHLVVAALGERRLRERATTHPQLPAAARAGLIASHAGTREHVSDLRRLLENPATTHDEAAAIFAALPDKTYSLARWAWCAHPHAGPEWLAQVADECFDRHDQGVIANVAEHPATPPAVLHRIALEHAHRDYALANPSCTPQTMLAVLDQRAGRAGWDTYGWRTRSAVAANPNATLDVLERVSAADLPSERRYDFALTWCTSPEQARTCSTSSTTGATDP